MTDPSQTGAGPVAKLFGSLLMAVGGLIAVLSGLCSLAFLGTMIQTSVPHPGQNNQIVGLLVAVLVFGGVPIGVGAGLFIIGRHLFRGPRTSA
jgi:hypothetical protein